MGIGDQLLATGMARGAAEKGKRIAFGCGGRILWDHNSPMIFRGNPNIAPPSARNDRDLIWIDFHKGHRQYNRQDLRNGRWIWNMDFRAKPGEVFFDDTELNWAEQQGRGFIVIEPNVPNKAGALNKDWPIERYREVAVELRRHGHEVVQFSYDGQVGNRLDSSRAIETPTFRHALAALARAALYVGPEGGLHHGAAAVGCRAVVLFGGFIPPQVTGYPNHINLTGGAAEACGSLKPCAHCRAAMNNISVAEVVDDARSSLAA